MEQNLSRKIRLEGLSNTRDLGGIKTVDGRFIRPCRLIRSGALFGASQKDLETLLGTYRLGTVVDFRTEAEREQKPDPILSGVENIPDPVLDEATVGITFEDQEKNGREKSGQKKADPLLGILTHAASTEAASGQYMGNLYQGLVLDDHAAKAYGEFFNILLQADSRAVLWHCTAGKDRVGVGTAMVLSALGVDRETVLKDFVFTNDCVKENVETVAVAIEERTGDRKTADCVRILLTVSRHYLENAFLAMENACGSVEAYLEERVGLTGAKQEQLKEKFLEERGPFRKEGGRL